MRFGYHVRVKEKLATALDEGSTAGCDTIQIFPGPPQQWGTPNVSREDIEEFRSRKEETKIDPVTIHSIYLVNLAAPDESIYRRSIGSLVSALKRADEIGAYAVVTHIGNHKGKGEVYGIERIASAVTSVFEKFKGEAMLLLETTAGSGTSIGHTFEQFGSVFSSAGFPEKLGFCLDTCHVYAAGYDVSSVEGLEKTLGDIDKNMGLERLKLLHLNDSLGGLGSRVDRHAHIGEGKIGLDGFRNIVNHPLLKELPAICEVPYESNGGKDIALLRSLENK